MLRECCHCRCCCCLLLSIGLHAAPHHTTPACCIACPCRCPHHRSCCSTGRKRRCGWFDAVVVNYAHALNGFASLNLTKMDVLDTLPEVKVGVAYKLDGRVLGKGEFPSTLEDLARVEVVYDTMPGWQTSIEGITSFEKLPAAAQTYVRKIEQVTGLPVSWIGTGPGREHMVTNGFTE